MLKALVVEDEHALQALYGRILNSAGYQVATASDGNDAIYALQHDDPPHLIVLDIRMPSCNGYEVLRFLQTYPNIEHIHVVIATASREFEHYVDMIPSAEFLLKPVLPPHLLTITRRQQVI